MKHFLSYFSHFIIKFYSFLTETITSFELSEECGKYLTVIKYYDGHIEYRYIFKLHRGKDKLPAYTREFSKLDRYFSLCKEIAPNEFDTFFKKLKLKNKVYNF